MHFLFCALVLFQASSTQTDWVGGPDVLGPVNDFGSTFYASDSININVPDQIAPVARQDTYNTALKWTKHTIESNSGIKCHGGLMPGDFDGDRDFDVAGYIAGLKLVRLYKNHMVEDDSVHFTSQRDLTVPANDKSEILIDVADVNRDGKPDIIVPSDTMIWYENQGDWNFTRHIIGYARQRSDTECCDVGDVDNDGDMDIVTGVHPLLLWRNNGSNTFAKESISAGKWWRIDLGDLNNDGYLDLLVSDQVFLNSSGSFNHTPDWTSGATGPDGHWLSDFNNDGKLDVLTGDEWAGTPGLFWWRNSGDGKTYTRYTIATGATAGYYSDGCIGADIDLDGMPDVSGTYSRVGYWRQNRVSKVFNEVVVDSNFSYSHWVYVKQLRYKPNGTAIGLDILATRGGQFAWWQNPMRPAFSEHAWLVSSVLDAGNPATWQYLVWDAIRPTNTQLNFYVRTGPTPEQCTTNVWQGPISVRTGAEFDSTSLQPYTTSGDRYFQYRVGMAGYNVPDPPVAPVVFSIKVVFSPITRTDVGVRAILAPAGPADSGVAMVPLAIAHNYGNVPTTTDIEFRVDDGFTSTVTRTIAAGADSTFAFAPWTPLVRGTHAVQCSTLLNDDNNSNNKATGSVMVRVTDVGATAILAPLGAVDSGVTIAPRATIHNWGNLAATFDVEFRIDHCYSNTITRTVGPGADSTFTFAAWTALVRGAHAVQCSTKLNDQDNRNNRKTDSTFVCVRNVGATRILAPWGSIDSGSTLPPQATVHNFGTNTESFDIELRIADGYASTITRTVAPGADSTFTFPDWNARSVGHFITQCSTELVGDVNRADDRVQGDVTVGYYDVGVTRIVAPVGTFDSGSSVAPQAVVHNFGSQPATFAVEFRVYDGYARTAALTLAAGADSLVSFPDWRALVRGVHVVKCSTKLNDMNNSNNKAADSVAVCVADIGVNAIEAPRGSVPYHSIVTPVAQLHNYGTSRSPADVTFHINGSLYAQTIHLSSGLPFVDTLLAFPTWFADTGYYFCRCSSHVAYDRNPANDTASGIFVVNISVPRWVRRTDVPTGSRLKRVRDGCALAYNEESDSGFIYSFKGNNTCEFYRYNVWTDRWTSAESIPVLNSAGRKKAVRKGAALTQIQGKLYGSKGNNTYDWWSFDPAVPGWHQCAPVPTGSRAVREGSGCVAVVVRDTTYVYLLKGSGTCEFYRYNTLTNGWQAMAQAPIGDSRKPYKNGSCLTYDPDCDTIYALKGSYNEFFAYSVSNNTWSSNEPLPRVSAPGSKSKKVKDGAGLAYHGGTVFALKGGNTYEFWKYPLDSHHWYPAEDFLAGPTLKRVKGGGALVYAPLKGNLYATKGNNTYEFYMYWLTDSIMGGRPALPSDMLARTLPYRTGFEIAPNPFKTDATIAYSLRRPGWAGLKLYDVSGALLSTLVDGYRPAGTYVYRLSPAAYRLSAGVYLVRYESEERTETRKIVVE